MLGEQISAGDDRKGEKRERNFVLVDSVTGPVGFRKSQNHPHQHREAVKTDFEDVTKVHNRSRCVRHPIPWRALRQVAPPEQIVAADQASPLFAVLIPRGLIFHTLIKAGFRYFSARQSIVSGSDFDTSRGSGRRSIIFKSQQIVLANVIQVQQFHARGQQVLIRQARFARGHDQNLSCRR